MYLPQIATASVSDRMPTTKARSRTVSTDSRGSAVNAAARAGCGLSMECCDEDLSPSQLNFYNK